MGQAIHAFQGLLRRSVVPSLAFLSILAGADLVYWSLTTFAGGDQVYWALTHQDGKDRTSWTLATGPTWLESRLEFLASLPDLPASMATALGLLLVVGISYCLAVLQQMLFDNRLKKDFDPGPRWRWARKLVGLPFLRYFSVSRASEGNALRELRGRVRQRLRSEVAFQHLGGVGPLTDYVLYEIVGGVDPTDTRGFVDSAKSIGIVTVSAMVVGVGYAGAAFITGSPGLGLGFLLLMVGVPYYFGREAVTAQYRARALRLYVNFLMMPTSRIWRILTGAESGRGDESARSA